LIALATTFLLALPAAADTRLADAAQAGDVATVRTLLADGADVNAFGYDGTPALHWAVRSADAALVELLLDAGADPDLPSRTKLTPLHIAAENGDVALLARLIEAGGDPNAVDYAGEPVLHTAARDSGVDAIALLLDEGAALDGRDEVYGLTALMVAAREGELDVVKLLIDRGADIEATGTAGAEPNFIPPSTITGTQGLGFVRGGWPERGIRMPIRGGMTPLLYAVREGRSDVATLLLDAGANLEHANPDHITPLLMAILNEHLALAQELIARGADVNAEDWWGETPVWAAVDVRNLDMRYNTPQWTMDNGVDRPAALELLRTLLERGADPNVRVAEYPPDRRWINVLSSIEWADVTGQTAFIRASVAADLEAMRLLLEHGADPNQATDNGTTALMSAAGVNWAFGQTYSEGPEALLEAVKLCLELGGGVNAVNGHGLTAAHAAANRGSDDILLLLHEHGARLDVADKHGRTPMDFAQGVFLATHAAVPKPSTIALLERLLAEDSAAVAEGGSTGD
jgi:ankyrin repeat protein